MNLYEVAQELAAQFTEPILIGGFAAVESGFTEVTTNDIDAIIMVADRGRARMILGTIVSTPITEGLRGGERTLLAFTSMCISSTSQSLGSKLS